MLLLSFSFSGLATSQTLQPSPAAYLMKAQLCLHLVLAIPHTHAASVSHCVCLFSTVKVLDV